MYQNDYNDDLGAIIFIQTKNVCAGNPHIQSKLQMFNCYSDLYVDKACRIYVINLLFSFNVIFEIQRM